MHTALRPHDLRIFTTAQSFRAYYVQPFMHLHRRQPQNRMKQPANMSRRRVLLETNAMTRMLLLTSLK